jgi:glutamate--cysteine ligase
MREIPEEKRPGSCLIRDKSLLTEPFYRGCKDKSEFKIGVEFERPGINAGTFCAMCYSGRAGTAEILNKLKNQYQYDEITENGNILGLIGAEGQITIEPGNQFEFSTIPYKSLRLVEEAVCRFNRQTSLIAEELGIIWIGAGNQPISTHPEMEMIPKERYRIMRNYLPQKGAKSPVMMMETAAIQTNIDYESEEDAMRKLRIALLLSPVITAIFANSPIRAGKLSGYKSFRALSWLDTDNDRCGLISKRILDGDFGFADYAETLLDVPMFFIKRDGQLIEAIGLTFREFVRHGFKDYKATMDDWLLHATTFFPEVRLKSYLEIRNCDCQRSDLSLAFPALIKGVMYSEEAISAVEELVKAISWQNLNNLRGKVPAKGLEARVNGHKLSDIAAELISIAATSLKMGENDESGYLHKVQELIKARKAPADIVIDSWNSCWGGDINRFIEYSRMN